MKSSLSLAFVIVVVIGKNYILEREIGQNNSLRGPSVGQNLGDNLIKLGRYLTDGDHKIE